MKHRMRKLQVAISLSVMLALVVVGMVSAAAPFTIDHFGGAQDFTVVYNSATAPNVGFDWVNDSNALGGQRDIVATITSASSNGQQLHITVNQTGDGRLTTTSGTDMVYSVQVQWDGTEGGTGLATIDKTGLSGVNLSSGGKDRFLLGIPASDQVGRIIIQVYGDASHCSEAIVDVDAGIGGLAATVYEVLYADFTTVCSGGYTATDFSSNIGALVLNINTLAGGESWDVALHIAAAGTEDYKDYGDLPQGNKPPNYKYENLRSGAIVSEAFNMDSGLTLGVSMTTELAKTGSDVGANTDEDNGVTPTGGTWAAGNGGGEVTVVVNGCPAAKCYLNGFIDWNKDRDFWNVAGAIFDAGEQVFSNYEVSNGTNVIPIDIPVGTVINSSTFYSRFRLTDEMGAIGGSPWGVYFSGEVEDYVWTFGPTAVSLAKFDANASTSSALPFAALLLPAGLGMLWVSRRRNR